MLQLPCGGKKSWERSLNLGVTHGCGGRFRVSCVWRLWQRLQILRRAARDALELVFVFSRHVPPADTCARSSSSRMDPAAVACSSPGKVLVAGGYLILERPHSGTVIGLDARFHSLVQLCEAPAAALPLAAGGLVIDVHSPQFHDHRRYVFRFDGESRLEPLPLGGGATLPKPNRYVEVPLLYTLALLRALLGDDFVASTVNAARCEGWRCKGTAALEIVLAADNGFYSQTAELTARGWPTSVESLRKLPPMLPPRPDADGEIAKTGLGSSATLVTSLVAALLKRFGGLQATHRCLTSHAARALPAANPCPCASCALSCLGACARSPAPASPRC